MKKLTKLNSRGHLHIVVPLLVVISIGLIGTYLLIQSRASSRYVKFSWSLCIYDTTTSPAKYVTYAQWTALGKPKPSTVNNVNGSYFVHYATSTSEIFLVPPNEAT